MSFFHQMPPPPPPPRLSPVAPPLLPSGHREEMVRMRESFEARIQEQERSIRELRAYLDALLASSPVDMVMDALAQRLDQIPSARPMTPTEAYDRLHELLSSLKQGS